MVTAKKTVIRDDNGKPQYLLTVVDDVTERLKLERGFEALIPWADLGLAGPGTDVKLMAAIVDELKQIRTDFSDERRETGARQEARADVAQERALDLRHWFPIRRHRFRRIYRAPPG